MSTKCRARLIRFFDPEWNRIATFAGNRGLTAVEFLRLATLAAIEDGDGGGAAVGPAHRGDVSN